MHIDLKRTNAAHSVYDGDKLLGFIYRQGKRWIAIDILENKTYEFFYMNQALAHFEKEMGDAENT